VCSLGFGLPCHRKNHTTEKGGKRRKENYLKRMEIQYFTVILWYTDIILFFKNGCFFFLHI
jgi:hypothetical protein